jgi:PQQ-dependent dehydrogenase (methanol/ethanol family)
VKRRALTPCRAAPTHSGGAGLGRCEPNRRSAFGLVAATTVTLGFVHALGAARAEDRSPTLPAVATAGEGRGSAPTSSAAMRVPAKSEADAGEDGEWPMVGKDYENRRFSGLGQIDASNVSQLKVAWTFSTGIPKGHEAAPLVARDTMYLVTPYPNHAYAFDLHTPGSAPKWRYQPQPSAASQGVACCDVINRGPALWHDELIYNTLDAHTVAVDVATGKERWRADLGDINRGETTTMAPIVVKGKVLVGNSGGEFGVRGWMTALDAATGKRLWRAYSTGPDAECLIGGDFHPFYPQDRGRDLGVTTWPPEKWKVGGGTVWGFVSYDAALDLVYYGTANPGVWNAELRPGDNKWSAGIFARHPDSGQAAWFYQWSPHDLYDHDGINENVLVDLTIGGRVRRVLGHADRNGYFYVVDRQSGELLSATPFVPTNSSEKVDLKSGKLIPVEAKRPQMGKVVRDICPAAPGAKDWQPMAFSPRTGWFYIPHNNICEDIEAVDASYIAGTPYVGATVRYKAGPGGNRGAFTAWDPVAGKAIFTLKERFPAWSGALATAGGLVFYGNMEGWFKAIDATTGKLLWSFQTGSGVIGQPISYRGPDGKQYVAVFSGVGGWAGAVVTGDLDTRDQTAGNGWGHMMKDLPAHSSKGGTLFVFSLP